MRLSRDTERHPDWLDLERPLPGTVDTVSVCAHVGQFINTGHPNKQGFDLVTGQSMLMTTLMIAEL